MGLEKNLSNDYNYQPHVSRKVIHSPDIRNIINQISLKDNSTDEVLFNTSCILLQIKLSFPTQKMWSGKEIKQLEITPLAEI